MKRHNKFIVLFLILSIIIIFISIILFGGFSIGEQGAKEQLNLISLIPKIGISIIIISIIIGLFLAMYIFPVFSLLILVVSAVRQRGINRKVFRTPVILLITSLISWNLCSIFTYGPGFYFHHDPGSKVYNEGYIIPYYEKMYGENLKLVDKNVIDAYNATYTLESGITGKCFTAESRYYDVGGGTTDRLHLYSGYEEILGERLENGEKIELSFNEVYRVKFKEKKSFLFDAWHTRSGYEIMVDSTNQEFKGRAAAKFYVSLERDQLVIEITLSGDQASIHRFPLESSK